MDQDEFDSRSDNFFHHTPYGLGVVCKTVTPFVNNVLSCYIAGVYNSDPNRLRKGGFAQINNLKSTMMNADNLDTRIGNQDDYHVSLFKKEDAHFLGFLYTANCCSFGEGHIINTLRFPVGVNRKSVLQPYGDIDLSKDPAGTNYIAAVHPDITLAQYDLTLNAHNVLLKERREANRKSKSAAPSNPISGFFASKKRKRDGEVTEAPTKAPTKKTKFNDSNATSKRDVVEEAESNSSDPLSALPVKELRRQLDGHGVDHRFFVEKSEFVERLSSIQGIASASNSRADKHRDNYFDEENVAASYKTDSEENAAPGMKRTVEEALEDVLHADLFDDQIDLLVSSKEGTDMNHMLFSMGRTKLTAKQYQGIRERERAKKRAAGENVPVSKVGAPVTLAREDRAACGVRACQTPGCRERVQICMDGKGWCKTALLISRLRRPLVLISHVDQHGVRCTTNKRFGGLCVKHCPNDHPKKVELTRKNAECMAKSRKNCDETIAHAIGISCGFLCGKMNSDSCTDNT
jgi:hypothetical protein